MPQITAAQHIEGTSLHHGQQHPQQQHQDATAHVLQVMPLNAPIFAPGGGSPGSANALVA